MLRSCSSWSAGQDLTEYSIQRALVATIEEAKHYVYIENQFFVSYVKGGSSREQPEQAEVFLNKFTLTENDVLVVGEVMNQQKSGHSM